MNMQLIIAIMSSTVISAFISSLITFLQNHKNTNLQYVTLERKEWREQIRSISEEICNAEIDNIDQVLTRLKVRINAYGNFENGTLLQDSVIWELIEQIEKHKKNPEIIEKLKHLLIESVALMLKYDWDRSKWEIKGNITKVLEKLSLFFFIIIDETFIYYRLGFNNVSVLVISLIILFIIIQSYSVFSDSIKSVYIKKLDLRLIKTLKNNMMVLLFTIAVYLYVFDKSLEISISAITATVTGVLYYFTVLYVPFQFWYILWSELLSSEIQSKQMYIDASHELFEKGSQILKTYNKESESNLEDQ